MTSYYVLVHDNVLSNVSVVLYVLNNVVLEVLDAFHVKGLSLISNHHIHRTQKRISEIPLINLHF